MIENHVAELQVDGHSFRFELCRKAERMGPVPIDQWWMDGRRLYGQRGRPATMGRTVIDYFWALCVLHGTESDPPVQESYILARLLPYARSNSARKVFIDSRPRSKRGKKGDDDSSQDLEALLQATRNKALSLAEFKDRTANSLGPPVLESAVVDLYTNHSEDFMSEARAALTADGEEGIQLAIRRWQKSTSAWGRRGGFALEKQVLDILSYECRAALHRCYSAVWSDLLPHLTATHHLDLVSQKFLHLWHFDLIREPEQDVPAWFHLFHGHIFGLHPAGGDLIRTPTGRELIGAWLTGPDQPAAFGRLLHAISIACQAYSLRRDTVSEDRRRRPQTMGALVEMAELETGRVESRGKRSQRFR